MKMIIKKIIVSLLAFVSVGLGLAIGGQLKKALLIVMLCNIVYLLAGVSGLLSCFYGFIATYFVIGIFYLYVLIYPFTLKNINLSKWIKPLLIYSVFAITIRIACVITVKQYFFEPLENKTAFENVLNEGDYVMVSKKKPDVLPHYLITQDNEQNVHTFEVDENIRHIDEYVSAINDMYYGTPLYIFWSKDFSRIGKRINHKI